ncbi:GntR family transcriptional regulator [Neorhodopirellula pilleata]|uniref:HTH-type transcriptional repressor YtrA n=1 Tax=Neorhodopirellula pilleata TaxID=2714738 RepID=A0A5C6AR97_9BACT|nr:GntR family transcriptional regulator [Neorhodopirellula pilleata]TWU02027.1 HTH-type transcriptional repressor YtrA [Neorhodopirellula pilleata]
MFLDIDFHADVAIYLQIVRQIKFAIAAGKVRPGELLPSARVLAGQLAINPNTVAHAYTELQNDGVIESLRGRGMAVCNGAATLCRRQRNDVLADRIGESLREAWNAGLSEEKIQSIVNAHLKRLAKAPPSVNSESIVPNENADV